MAIMSDDFIAGLGLGVAVTMLLIGLAILWAAKTGINK